MNDDERVVSDIDIDRPIDIGHMVKRCAEFGPLRLSNKSSPVEIVIAFSKCLCGASDCDVTVITVHRLVGLSQISWTLSVEELESFGTLDDYFRYASVYPADSSSGERQVIEAHILGELGKHYSDVDHPFCACTECAGYIGETELWKKHLLTSLAIYLNNLAEVTGEIDEEDRDEFMSTFDAGYALGRMAGEYFLKARVEEDAKRGIEARAAMKARTTASGLSSSDKRNRRVLALLESMENLARENPAFLRIGVDALAELAIEDAAQIDPDLWSQGKGRRAEYLDELQSDIRYQSRFHALLKTA